MKSNKFWIIILAIFILLCVAAIAIFKLSNEDNKLARVILDGKCVREINLDEVEDAFEFTVNGDGNNIVQVEKGRIRIIEADCPDKICVNQGWINNGFVPIVCLPNRIVVEIVNGNYDIDGAAK